LPPFPDPKKSEKRPPCACNQQSMLFIVWPFGRLTLLVPIMQLFDQIKTIKCMPSILCPEEQILDRCIACKDRHQFKPPHQSVSQPCFAAQLGGVSTTRPVSSNAPIRLSVSTAHHLLKDNICTWKISIHGAHIKLSQLILDLTSLVVWYILLRTPCNVVVCSGGRCYL
jgi:hypothetical protein